MKLLYGINTNGQGHINRARGVIRQLLAEGNQVDVLFSGPPPPDYAKGIVPRWKHILGFTLHFHRQHSINPSRTLFTNILKFKQFPRLINQVRRTIIKEEYDGILTDFEGFTSVAGFLARKPVISIDHQHSLIHPLAVWAPTLSFDIIVALGLVLYCVPFCSHYFAIDYVQKPKRMGIGTLFPLFHRPEIKNYTPTVGDHYTVYLPYVNPRQVYRVFQKFPDETFHVYGLNRNENKGNVIYKPTSREGFLADMASSRGVIAHSGFSITWEVILFKKMLYTVPLSHHHEQLTNAHRLKKLQLAYVAPNLSENGFHQFRQQAEQQHFQTQANLTIAPPSILTKTVYQEIEKFRFPLTASWFRKKFSWFRRKS